MTGLIDTLMLIPEKNVSKFSGLRWFFLFEDLYSEEGSLQLNRTRI